MINYNLSEEKLIYLIKVLNPNVDIRKVYDKENKVSFCSDKKLQELVIPYSFYCDGAYIKKLNSNASYKVISLKEVEEKSYLTEKIKPINYNPKVRNIYIYVDRSNRIKGCMCYDYGYKLVSGKKIIKAYFDYKKGQKDIYSKKHSTIASIKELDNIIEIISGDIDYSNIEALEEMRIKNTNPISKSKEKYVISAKTDKGKRKVNEDSSIVITHKYDDSIKLLAVADGIGGCNYGDISSTTATSRLKDWFQSVNVKVLALNEIKGELKNIINEINNEILSIYPEESKGTTLTMALILKKVTIIANIGDSRTYKISNGELTQLTEDDSLTWLQYKNGYIQKDDIRFSKFNNIILNSLGFNQDVIPNIQIIRNDSYDSLILLSDGVTDLLSDNKIQFIANNMSKELIADLLVKEAAEIKQSDKLSVGKDNASAIVYMKKK